MFEIRGMDELSKKLEDLSDRASEIAGCKIVCA